MNSARWTYSGKQMYNTVSSTTAQSSGTTNAYHSRFKRWFDIGFTALTLPIFLPLGLIIAVLIRLDSPGPVFVKLRRLGAHGSVFYKYKFRTMIVNAEQVLQNLLSSDPIIREEYERTYKIRKDPRITRFGKLLRLTSLDEMPQIINIIRDEMTWVGPRDILPQELVMYGEDAEKFLTVLPGLTGLWQVSGRSRLPYSERVRLDMVYIDGMCVWEDVRILLHTIRVVLTGDGAL